MSDIQELLDQEATLSNKGGNSEEVKKIHTIIRLKRIAPPPVCFGEDDCSTMMLSRCPWRIDCGAEPYYNWGG
jgi:hypothetical protein